MDLFFLQGRCPSQQHSVQLRFCLMLTLEDLSFDTFWGEIISFLLWLRLWLSVFLFLTVTGAITLIFSTFKKLLLSFQFNLCNRLLYQIAIFLLALRLWRSFSVIDLQLESRLFNNTSECSANFSLKVLVDYFLTSTKFTSVVLGILV